MLGAITALGTLLYFPACGPTAGEPPIGEEEYVETYVEILRASDEAGDELAASERAREILARRGISEDDLLEFARRHSDDPAYIAELWRRIELRLRNPEPTDSGAPPEETAARGR